MEQAVIEILKDVDVYDQARRLVNSDAELVELFQNDFTKLARRLEG